jgi:hypothetical protein
VIPSELKAARIKRNNKKKNKSKGTQESLDVSIWNANGCEFRVGTFKHTELQLHQLSGVAQSTKDHLASRSVCQFVYAVSATKLLGKVTKGKVVPALN